MNAENISQWLRLLQKCIRNRDYATARTLFHDSVKSFGANGVYSIGLDDTHKNEWLDVWTEQINFTFDQRTAGIIDFGAAAVVTIQWHARGKIHGSPERTGNATFILHILELKKNSGLFCIHSHTSKA